VNSISIFLICLLLFVFSISYLVITSLAFEIQKLNSTTKKNLSEYLDLATTTQLCEEMSKRDNLPIILVRVNHNGILVDCYGVPPALSVHILEKSADLVREKIINGLDDQDI